MSVVRPHMRLQDRTHTATANGNAERDACALALPGAVGRAPPRCPAPLPCQRGPGERARRSRHPPASDRRPRRPGPAGPAIEHCPARGRAPPAPRLGPYNSLGLGCSVVPDTRPPPPLCVSVCLGTPFATPVSAIRRLKPGPKAVSYSSLTGTFLLKTPTSSGAREGPHG